MAIFTALNWTPALKGGDFHRTKLPPRPSGCRANLAPRLLYSTFLQIEELDITFDPVAYYHQLMRAGGEKEFPVVPNTLQNALQDKKSRIVVTTPRVRGVLDVAADSVSVSLYFALRLVFFFLLHGLLHSLLHSFRGVLFLFCSALFCSVLLCSALFCYGLFDETSLQS